MGGDEDQDRTVNKYKQLGLSLAADLALFGYGSCFTMSSVVLPQLEQESNAGLTITSEEGSWFASVFVIGSISGALVGGFSGEKLGRKKALLIDNIIMVLGKVVDTNQNIIIKLRQHIFCILYIFSTIVSNRLIFY